MRVVRAELHAQRIPFRFAFSHARRARRHSDAIHVTLVSTTGACGHGEALARPYVTGETAEDCYACLEEHLLPALLLETVPDCETAEALFRWIHSVATAAMPDDTGSAIIARNAARCAMELALVDLWLRERGEPLASLLPPRRARVRYSGVIPATSRSRSVAVALALRAYGFRSSKIKVRGPGDAPRLRAIRSAVGGAMSLRIDANGACTVDEAVALSRELEPARIDAFEEPTAREHSLRWSCIADVSRAAVMADESVVTLEDAKRLAAAGAASVLNLRLAKLGGIFPTVQLARWAEANGLGYQLGCLVGETAVLSAAGRAVAAHLTAPKWTEGSYGSWLLRHDISRERLGFERGGWARTLTAPGLGVEVDARKLALHRMRHTVLEG